MKIQFATCEINRALEYLQTGYKNTKITKEGLPKLCDALGKDIVRITDPSFHRLALVIGKNYKNSHKSLMEEIIKEITELA